MERRRALRPLVALGRRWRPQFEFLGRRLTPGGLGLELTTLLAALSVGLFVLIAYWSVIAGDPGPTPGDQTAYDVANSLQAGWLVHIAKGVTYLGSGMGGDPDRSARRDRAGGPAPLARVLGPRGRDGPGRCLVPEIKSLTDRPRPPGHLVTAHGSAFPSGHAAHSTLYTWLAITFALRVVPGIKRRSAVIAAGIAAHRPDRAHPRLPAGSLAQRRDPGWALGVSCFSAVAIVVLVIAHIRDNSRRHERAPQLDPGAGAGARALSTTSSRRGGALAGRLRGPDPGARARLLRPRLGEARRGLSVAVRAGGPGADRTGARGGDLPQLGPDLRPGYELRSETSAKRHADPGSLEELSAAIEAGAGMPAVARAAGRALGASVALIDKASSVLAVAAASPDEERKLLAGGAGVETVELRVADTSVGELRWRPREEDEPDAPCCGWSRRWSGWSWSAPARRSGRPRRPPATSFVPCSSGRSPTGATSRRVPRSWARTSLAAQGS